MLGSVGSSSSIEMRGDVYVEGDVKSSSKVVADGMSNGGMVRIGGRVDASGGLAMKGSVEVGTVESSGRTVISSLEKQRIVIGDLTSRGSVDIEGDVEIR